MSTPSIATTPTEQTLILMEGVEKWYGSFQALKSINLSVRKGEKIVLCGPSGSGKSTLIRCINHLESYQKGRIVVDGVAVTDNPRAIDIVRQEVGMVFQSFNLFPHMTVLQNCMLAPMRVRGTSKAEAEAIKLIRSKGKDVSDEALAELVSRVGPNIALLTSEIEKLSLLLGDRPEITVADVRTSVSRQKVARAFALAEALGDRNLPKLIKTLDEELCEIRTGADKKKSEIGLLYGLITKVRNMILLKELKTAGILKASKDYYGFKAQLETVNPESLPADRRFNPLASHPFVLFQAMRQTDNYDLPELIRAMELMLDANRSLVSSGLDEAIVLQKLVLDIAAAPRAAKPR